VKKKDLRRRNSSSGRIKKKKRRERERKEKREIRRWLIFQKSKSKTSHSLTRHDFGRKRVLT